MERITRRSLERLAPLEQGGAESDGQLMRLVRVAASASSRRLAAPTLSNMRVRWCLIVSSLTVRRRAISLVAAALTTSESTSLARRQARRGAYGAAPTASADVRSTSMRPVTSVGDIHDCPDVTQTIASNRCSVAESFGTSPRAPS